MRLIDADSVIEYLKEQDALVLRKVDMFLCDVKCHIVELKESTEAHYCLKSCIGEIENAPTVDAVPVIRCKDCKYNYANMIPSDNQCSRNVELEITAEDFCSWAERIME